eukprot:CAMPEP_0172761852 /NCGR_PEP_ID=MMETSP1074-20121228/172316_1 /TAXON_ID=2916 /ORGANISM="Ceratium fusus, Strain PA161109" /LENGTH=128 /DNA_ID=CAMNT_0013596147 /DNA_START=35 /DNA_END=419 /DNA_ORIENTATION=-
MNGLSDVQEPSRNPAKPSSGPCSVHGCDHKVTFADNEVPVEYPTEGQEHVFTFYDQLTEERQSQLYADFESIHVDEVDQAFNLALESSNSGAEGDLLEAPYVMNWDLKKPPMARRGANVAVLADVPES